MSEDPSDDHESSESSSSEEEEDENAKEWTDEIEKTFLKTLSSLKKKDPKIYDGNVKFFQDELISSKHPPAPKEEHLYLRDYERKIILEKNGILTDEESDDEAAQKIADERSKSPTYVEEQRILKDNFKKFLNDDDSNESDDDCTGFLKVKEKTKLEKEKEEADYIEWMKGQKSELDDKQTEGELKFLRDYWIDPNLNEGEQFIRDYILNKRYLEPDEESQSESELSFSEEEKVLEECDEYEQNYNFRFEEPDKNFIKTYPRVIENSLRRKDEKRKQKREMLKKRKEEKLEQKRLEVKKLKKQKKQEILQQIQKLKQITGNEELGFNDDDLQKDFSPDEYDKKMSELFNEEFYELNEDEKPQFSDSDSFEYDEDDENEEENYADSDDDDGRIKNEEEADANDNPITEDNIIMDCDYDPTKAEESKFKKQTRSSRRKGHKKSKLMEVIRQEKPAFNAADKTFQQYLDEYYSLDFEDMIGDMPCRFKYRKVPSNSFGLSVEEILAADDKELNNWCSMKKIDTIRPEKVEKFEQKVYTEKGKNLNLKKKLLPSLFNEDQQAKDEPAPTSSISDNKEKAKKSFKSNNEKSSVQNNSGSSSKKKKSKFNKPSKDKDQNDSKSNFKDQTSQSNSGNLKRKMKNTGGNNFKKRKLNHETPKKNRNDKCEIADERLKAYGINPKRFKNKLKYGPKS